MVCCSKALARVLRAEVVSAATAHPTLPCHVAQTTAVTRRWRSGRCCWPPGPSISSCWGLPPRPWCRYVGPAPRGRLRSMRSRGLVRPPKGGAPMAGPGALLQAQTPQLQLPCPRSPQPQAAVGKDSLAPVEVRSAGEAEQLFRQLALPVTFRAEVRPGGHTALSWQGCTPGFCCMACCCRGSPVGMP